MKLFVYTNKNQRMILATGPVVVGYLNSKPLSINLLEETLFPFNNIEDILPRSIYKAQEGILGIHKDFPRERAKS